MAFVLFVHIINYTQNYKRDIIKANKIDLHVRIGEKQYENNIDRRVCGRTS